MSLINLKFKIPSLQILTCCSFALLLSCQSHEQKADSAFEILKHEKEFSHDSLLIQSELDLQATTTEVVHKAVIMSEWELFKNNFEKKTNANDQKIHQLSKLNGVSDRTQKRINNLKQENNDLRKSLNEYREAEKVRWETFKTEMMHNINTIEIELKDISLNSKK